MPPELSGRDLDRRIAELLGWEYHKRTRNLPEWHADLNAVFQDVVPAVKARGVYPLLRLWPLGEWVADFIKIDSHDYHDSGSRGHGESDNPATAICHAFVALANAERSGRDAGEA